MESEKEDEAPEIIKSMASSTSVEELTKELLRIEHEQLGPEGTEEDRKEACNRTAKKLMELKQ